MDNSKIGHHIYRKFDQELEDIQNQVLTLGRLVEEQIDLAMDAYISGDFTLAEKSIKSINQVYALKKSLDDNCIQILVLRQPAAFDLRFLITVIKIIHELELIGGLAEGIAKMAIQLSKGEGNEITDLSESVKSVLHVALTAFARINVNDIAVMNGLDKNINRAYTHFSLQLTSQMMEEPQNITRILEILRIARALECIGDHAYHICEELIYMVNGERERLID
ncbi:MAG: phosphate signaling complex protein PhoU [Methylococcaceae bacterium]|nr:phosphate signaling complex protein PhoU [Methylococcaceae bacterium]